MGDEISKRLEDVEITEEIVAKKIENIKENKAQPKVQTLYNTIVDAPYVTSESEARDEDD